jgi:serine/threonine protein kinase
VLGTPYYMSPEQARGLRSVDYRSDLWSVAVIAFRCMTGRLPFEGEAVGDVLVKLCTAPIPVPSTYAPDLPPAFDAWLVRALGREPEARFQSAMELGRALANVCGLTAPLTPNSGEQLALGALPPRTSPLPGNFPIQHSPFAATTPSPALTPAGIQTGAPITQTPAPSTKPGKSAIIAAALAAFAVVGIGIGVVIKGFAKSETPIATGAPEVATVAPPKTAPDLAPSAAAIATAPHVVVVPVPLASAAAVPPSSASNAATTPVPVVTQAPLATSIHRQPVVHATKSKPSGAAPEAAPPKPVSDMGF